MKKKQLFLIALIVLLVSSIGYGTYAYTTVEGTASSVITTSGVSIDLVEKQDDGSGRPIDRLPDFPGHVSGVVPTATESKIVYVENDGPRPVWVRIAVDVNIALDPNREHKGSGDPDESLVRMDIDTANWKVDPDGFYRYAKPLKPGEMTKPLFTTVTFDASMGNMYQGSTATVNVSAQATQYENNEHGDNVLEVLGWPANNQ